MKHMRSAALTLILTGYAQKHGIEEQHAGGAVL